MNKIKPEIDKELVEELLEDLVDSAVDFGMLMGQQDAMTQSNGDVWVEVTEDNVLRKLNRAETQLNINYEKLYNIIRILCENYAPPEDSDT